MALMANRGLSSAAQGKERSERACQRVKMGDPAKAHKSGVNRGQREHKGSFRLEIARICCGGMLRAYHGHFREVAAMEIVVGKCNLASVDLSTSPLAAFGPTFGPPCAT